MGGHYPIEKAKYNSKRLGIKDISFYVRDITEFNVSQKFDLVLISEVIEHLEDDRSIIRKYSNYLNEGGYLICSVPFDRKLWSEEDNLSGHVRRYNHERIKWLIKSSQIELVDLLCYGFPFLRLWWIYKAKTQTHKKVNLYNKLGKIFFSSSMTFAISFLDSFIIKSKKGVGIIFISKKIEL